MRRLIKISFSVIALAAAIALTLLSVAPYEGHTLLFSILILIMGGFIISLTMAAWSSQNPKKAFVNSLEISLGLSASVYVIGYLFFALQPILFR